jgi:fused signal recognition particle receptor
LILFRKKNKIISFSVAAPSRVRLSTISVTGDLTLNMVQRLKEGLVRTRDRLSQGLGIATSGAETDWDRLEEALLSADLGVTATSEILEAVRSIRGNDVQGALASRLVAILEAPEKQCVKKPSGSPEVILVVGVNGTGKTTSVAKLAHQAIRAGRKPLLVAADTFRAAAIEQLETWADRVGAELVKGLEGADAAAVVHDGLQAALARRADVVIIDTAGRLHTKRPLMDELAKVKRVAGRVVEGAPHQTLLVMDATVGGNGLMQAREFSESLGVEGIILTKLDGTAKGGIVVAVARELGIPVRYTGVGEGLEDLLAFSPEDFVAAIMGD